MTGKDEEFLKKLLETFKVEALEHITALTGGLIELEKNKNPNSDKYLIETIFREAHSLKGAARSVNMKNVESICQLMEDIFAKLKNENISLQSDQFDSIHKAADMINILIANHDKKTSNDFNDIVLTLKSIYSSINDIQVNLNNSNENITKEATELIVLNSDNSDDKIESIDQKILKSETVRIMTSKLDPLFLQAEQMLQIKISSSQRTADIKNIINDLNIWKTELQKWDSDIRNNSEVHLKEYINWNNESLDKFNRNIYELLNRIKDDHRTLARMIADHVESMKSLLMLPISTVVEGFPKIVRDLARSQNKVVEIEIQGQEVEVDKRVLEEFKDPLLHLIRNCIDHGIKQKNKTSNIINGKITLKFSTTDSSNLLITLSDNGKGINLEELRAAALKAGVISESSLAKLSDNETLMLIFESGVSTSKIITDLSGRGLGLAIVRERVEKLGGSVFVENNLDCGSTFRFQLPLKLSSLRGVLIRVGEHQFVVPTGEVERTLRINIDEIKNIENVETITFEGKIIPIISLAKTLGIAQQNNVKPKKDFSTMNKFLQLIILLNSGKRIAFVVDEIYEEFQILTKDLGKQLTRVRNISSATILGSGKVTPVLNVSDLFISAFKIKDKIIKPHESEIKKERNFNILVADDSITSRVLIKNIVESAGYNVETAVDGIDAFTKALVGDFDLIVSDVDMPRLNGFELVSKIRKDNKLKELPVILVTALESREDREQGIDVGANAYIIKSSFDQSNLLEIIDKLV